MAKAILIARIVLGLPLVVFGLNYWLMFIEPDPTAFTPEAQAWLGALEDVGYLNPLKSAVEVLCGLLLIAGRWVPFALVVFAPVLINIVAFHLWPDKPSTGVIAFLMLGLELFLAWAYWPHFKGVCSFNAKPRGSD